MKHEFVFDFSSVFLNSRNRAWFRPICQMRLQLKTLEMGWNLDTWILSSWSLPIACKPGNPSDHITKHFNCPSSVLSTTFWYILYLFNQSPGSSSCSDSLVIKHVLQSFWPVILDSCREEQVPAKPSRHGIGVSLIVDLHLGQQCRMVQHIFFCWSFPGYLREVR